MEDEDLEIMRRLEIHREVICNQIHARRLLDRMRSRCVFTKDECEEILNEMLNPNSTTKAGCFLDNLQRKGPSGYHVFVEYLGEMYPDLYQTITGREPEAPAITPCYTSTSSVASNSAVHNKIGDVIGDLSQEVEDLRRELEFSNQSKLEQEREIQHLNQALNTASKKAKLYTKVEKARRTSDDKVSALKDEVRALLANSLLHKEDKDRAVERLREKMQKVNELERHLKQAKDQAEVRREIWHQTCMVKQQLKVDREKMLQQMSSMEEELKQAKRHEDVRISLISAKAVSEDRQIDQHTQAAINILEDELKNYKEKCEELGGNLLQARNELHHCDTEFEKCKSENEELKQKEQNAKKMVELYKSQYNVTWQDLNRVKQHRNRAIGERNSAQMESMAHLDHLHKQQEMMNVQLQNLAAIYPCQHCRTNSTQCENNTDSRRGSNDSKDQPERGSFHSSNSEVSMQTYSDTADCADATQPSNGEEFSASISTTDLQPFRPRAHNIAREVEITNRVYNENTFPIESFSYPLIYDGVDEAYISNAWMHRHHAEPFGDSRKVHPGSMKAPHLLSLWEDSSNEDEDEDFDVESEEVDKEEEEEEKVKEEPSGGLHRRSLSWNNLLSTTGNSDPAENVRGQPPKHQQTRYLSVPDGSLECRVEETGRYCNWLEHNSSSRLDVVSTGDLRSNINRKPNRAIRKRKKTET